MLNNSEKDRNKSAQHQVKSRHYKWLLLMTEKKSYQFLKYARAYLRKRRYAPASKDTEPYKFGGVKPPIKVQGCNVEFKESVTRSLV